MLETVAQQVVNALSLGGIYALLALGLAIIFSVMGLINFAYGDLMTIGGYAMWLLVISLGSPLMIFGVAGVIAAALSSVAMERVAFRPVRGASPSTMLLTSFAVSIVLQVSFQNFVSPRAVGVSLPAGLASSVRFLGVRIGALELVGVAIVLLGLLTLSYVLQRTTLGIGMRAAAQDFDIARLMGLNANRIVATAFAISGVLAGLAGFLWVAQRGSVEPAMGLTPVVKAFIAAVLGGMGSLVGAVVGGFTLGSVEVLFEATIPEELLPYKDALALVTILGILYWRPMGLFGQDRDRA